MQAQYGLIGYPLNHSFSPAWFRNKFAALGIDAMYSTYPIPDISMFPELLASHPGLRGLNVTIPYKESIISYLDELDDAVTEIGAVNCISIINGKKKGYNTDVLGFEDSLKPLLKPWHKNALILGTGGAAKAVAYVLEQLGISYKTVSRNPPVHQRIVPLSYPELSDSVISEHRLIINTTPLGMYPDDITFPPIPYYSIGNQHLLYDLVYNPTETKFLSLGKANGATIKNGMEMLELQAEASWGIWNNE